MDISREEIQKLQSHITELRERLTHISPHSSSIVEERAHLWEVLQELETAEAELYAQSDALVSTQAEVERERARYRELFEFAPDGYLLTDALGIIWEANREASRLLRLPERGLMGKPLREHVVPDERVVYDDLINSLPATSGIRESELRLLPRSGVPFDAAISVSPSKDTEHNVIGVRWTIRDITWKKEAERELHAAREQLEQRVALRTAELAEANTTLLAKNAELKLAQEERRRLESKMLQAQKLESLGVLAGGIAHDFNNLLTGILGHAAMLSDEVVHSANAQDLLREIQKAGVQAADLIRQLLAYAGKTPGLREIVNWNEIIREGMTLLRTSIGGRASFHIDLSQDTPPVRGDRAQMLQIILNLVTNAAESVVGGKGSIVVSTGAMECNREFLRACALSEETEPGLYSFVQVIDTGGGIGAEEVDKVFDPFFTTKQTGRGLGLSAVHGIVRNHGGMIRVESWPKRRTVFQVLLPACKEMPLVEIEEPAAAPPRRLSGDVLIIDDEPTVLSFASRVLRQAGMEVSCAVGGSEGFERFAENPAKWDLVLVDLTMPDLGGGDVIRKIRAIRPDAPVILMSGYQAAAHADEIQSASAFLHKPFTPEELLMQIASLAKTV